jgi:hypothetical protein
MLPSYQISVSYRRGSISRHKSHGEPRLTLTAGRSAGHTAGCSAKCRAQAQNAWLAMVHRDRKRGGRIALVQTRKTHYRSERTVGSFLNFNRRALSRSGCEFFSERRFNDTDLTPSFRCASRTHAWPDTRICQNGTLTCRAARAFFGTLSAPDFDVRSPAGFYDVSRSSNNAQQALRKRL